MQVAVKLVLLFTHGVLRPTDMHGLNTTSERAMVELLLEYDDSRLDGYVHRPDPTLGRRAALKLTPTFEAIEADLLRCVEPHTTEKSLGKLKATTRHFSDPASLERILIDPMFTDTLSEIIDTIRLMLMPGRGV